MNSKYLAFLGLFLVLCKAHVYSQEKQVLLYQDEANMSHPIFSTWLLNKDTWYMLPIYNNNGEAIIRSWPKNGPLQEIARTTAKTGISYISGAAINEKNELAIRGYLKNVIYKLSLDRPESGFSLVAPAPDLPDQFVYWDDHTLVGGSNKQKLGSLTGKITQLDTMNNRIPDGAHPSIGHVNHQRMMLAQKDHKLAVSFTLSNQVAWFDKKTGHLLGKAFAKFPGYTIPPNKYLKKFTDEADYAYISSFHHLAALAWYKDRLFGLYQKGYEEHGTWISLSGSAYIYKNDAHEVKIQALAGSEVVLGKLEYNKEGEVAKWVYWRTSSLP